MKVINQLREWCSAFFDWFTRARWWKKALVMIGGLILFVLLMDSVIMPWYTRLGDEYELPDVTEKPLEEAKEILDENGFIPIVQDSVYHAFYPPGTVTRQNPASYSTVKRGRRVYLVVSAGAKPVYMPNLIAETLTNAELKLREVGLRVGSVFRDYSTQYPYRGVVTQQSVPPGEKVLANTPVNLTISLGPPPASLNVPNLAGKSLESAVQELQALGFAPDQILQKYRFRPNLVPNTVIGQSAPPGTPVSEVAVIELLVSTDQVSGEQNTGRN